jgi:hypothetical protein
MKKHILFIVSFLSFFSFSQTYYLEDFDGVGGPTAGGAGTYTFAPGFLLRNVDNRVPDASVSYINEAWERREDFGQNVTDSVAFSTSYYSPVGAANDFMWTPAQTILPNTTLFWNARSYDLTYLEAYEVRIMTVAPTGGTGVIGNQLTSSTVIFSTATESSSWTTHPIPLTAYTGQTVYIGFRNLSNDKFILVIDDIELRVINNFDLEVITPTQNPYTIAPANQLTTPQNFKLEAVIHNQGLQAMTDVALGCQVIKDGILETTVISSSIPSLASGATSAAMTATYTPTSNGVYTFKYFPIATDADMNTANDTIQSALPITVTDSEIARDNGIVVGQLGIGAGSGYLGQVFNIENTTSLTSVKVYFTRGYTGKKLATAIFNTNGSGVPTTFFASTDTLLYIDDSARMYTLPMHGGSLTLTPGKYGFIQIEFDSTLALAQTSAVFQTNTVFANWPANPFGPNFASIENFGAGFQKSFLIRPQFDVCFGEIGGVLSNSTNSTCELANGDATVALEPGYSVEWEDASTNATVTGLSSGTYTYTISNATCSFIDSVEITTTEVPDASILSTANPLCIGDSGQIEIEIQNGQVPYMISWNIAGDSTILVAPAGTYTATITDAGGCTTSISSTLNDPTPILANSSSTNSTCSTCPDGIASVSPTGGTPPYSYLWSDGNTTNSITNTLPGTYNVTITDANGCEMSASVTINFSTLGIDELLQFGVTVYPNPMTDFIKIESTKDAIESAQLIDNSGRLVMERTINGKVGTMETTQLAKGNYQLILKTGDQTFKVQVVK